MEHHLKKTNPAVSEQVRKIVNEFFEGVEKRGRGVNAMTAMNELNDERKGTSWHDWQERNRLQDLHGVALRVQLTKYASIAVLLLTVVFWGRAADYQVWLRFAVCAGAVRVAFLAGAVRRHDWASLFFSMALLYNPVFPLFALNGRLEFLLVIATAGAFAASLFLLKPRLTPEVAGR